MSKFTIKLKLTGLELEVEGTREDAPKIAARIGEQLSGFLQPTTLLENGNGSSHKVINADVDGNGTGKKKKAGRKSAGTGSKSNSEDLSFVHDSAKYGSPVQGWSVMHKAIWFLWIAGEQAENAKQLTAYAIMKNFNLMFRAAGTINNGNIMRGFEKEKLKGANAPVGSDANAGTAKYFLTQAGITLAQRLAKGEAVTAD
jgi:hypothetical protein